MTAAPLSLTTWSMARLRLEVSLVRRRASVARTHAAAYLGDQVVAECEMFLGIVPDRTEIDATAIVHPSAQIGDGHFTITAAYSGPANGMPLLDVSFSLWKRSMPSS
jgi:hypothetical protein